ncbi:MAG: hypothetical protein JSU70_21440 [Phycisphaerales bacterium]|nr:MAG: hypothetical protein JSU70_21440 [Phycisphaerales bacterium]
MKRDDRNMRRASNIAALITALVGQTSYGGVQEAPGNDIEGLWSGGIEIPGQNVPPIIFRIIKNLDGESNAYLESPDQVHRIRASRVTYADGDLRLDVNDIGGVFEGKAASDNSTIKGH